MKITDPAELATLAMQTYDASFAQTVRTGDLIVGGANFGYGHPHYPPLRALRHLGVAGVIAESFSPGFWRGEISMGTILGTSPGIVGIVERWDEIEVDRSAGEVRNLTRGGRAPLEPLSDADTRMLEAGGLVGYLKAAAPG